MRQIYTLLLQDLDLRLALGQQQLQICHTQLRYLMPGQGLPRLLANQRRILTLLILYRRKPFASVSSTWLLNDCLLGNICAKRTACCHTPTKACETSPGSAGRRVSPLRRSERRAHY